VGMNISTTKIEAASRTQVTVSNTGVFLNACFSVDTCPTAWNWEYGIIADWKG